MLKEKIKAKIEYIWGFKIPLWSAALAVAIAIVIF